MIERARNSMTALGAIATCCLVMAGCAGVKHEKTAERVPTAVPAEAITVAEPPEVVTPEAVPMDVPEAATIPQPTTPAPTVVVPSQAREPVIPPVRPATPFAAAPRVAVAEAPASTPPAPRITPAKPPVKPPASAATPPMPPAVPKAATAPAPVASPPARAPLDLESLGTRLKQTKAIGVLTKLSLKNQVDDLLAKFRAYHARQGAATLPELRRSYDMLLLKVLSLLQDSDPPLARDIVQSRAAIWGILADPKKFNEARLMAGATT